MWKKTVKCDIGTDQRDDEIVKCEKTNYRKLGYTECDKSTVIYDIDTAQCDDETIKWGKKNGPTECNKSTVICDIDITQCDNEAIKCEKKQSNVILVPINVMMKLSNVRKQIIEN